MNGLQRSSSLLCLFRLERVILKSMSFSRTRSIWPHSSVNFCTKSSGTHNEDLEEEGDFFGIPSNFKLQQTRMEQVDIEEQYFGNHHRDDSSCSENFSLRNNITPRQKGRIPQKMSEVHTSRPRSRANVSEQWAEQAKPHLDSANGNLFDEQYFEGALEIERQENRSMFKPKSTNETSAISNQQLLEERVPPVTLDASQLSEFNFIDDQYWGNQQLGGESDIHSVSNLYNISDERKHSQEALPQERTLSKGEEVLLRDSYDNYSPHVRNTKCHDNRNHSLVSKLKNPQGQLNKRAQVGASGEPVTAHDVALKFRRELKNSAETTFNVADRFSANLNLSSDYETEGKDGDHESGKKRDSQGFRVLSDQLLDLNKMTTSDIVLMLRRKIIFNHDDFLVIDKPYGLPSLDNNHDRLSLKDLLPKLCKTLPPKYNASNLHLVQGLDRDVTGAVILAKSEESAYLLKGMFNANEITQRFWAITKGVPNPRAGVIDIPVGEAKVNGIYKMVLRPLYSNKPEFRRRTSKSRSAEAITEYKVLVSHQEAALVECQPLTKLAHHQIRVHLSNGLNTPILGDHKYSHFSKLAPQKLNRSTLELLHTRQAKARHLALHLHCHTLVIPSYKARTFIVPTKLPPHFFRNMKSLKLSLK